MSEEREIREYRLVIAIHGPHFHDVFAIGDPDPLNLEPSVVMIGGVEYQHYGDDVDFIEVRADHVIQRSMTTVFADDDSDRPHARSTDPAGSFAALLGSLDKGEKI